MRKLYLAGPMTGISDFNTPAFDSAAAWLRSPGGGSWEVVSPPELDAPGVDIPGVDDDDATVTPEALAAFMRRDLGALVSCDAIGMLPGWRRSTGANCELMVARIGNLKVLQLSPFGLSVWKISHAPNLRHSSALIVRHLAALGSTRYFAARTDRDRMFGLGVPT